MVRRIVIASALAMLVLASCSEDDPDEVTHPLLEDSPATDQSTPDAVESSPGLTSDDAEFPRECGQIISAVRVAEIVASVPTQGMEPRYMNDYPDSPRVERLECRYGTEADADEDRDEAVVEIAVSSYVDAASAAAQVSSNVDDARIAGQTVEDLEIAGRPVVSLTDEKRISYLLADGIWTYVVSLVRDMVGEPDAEQVVLISLVEELLAPAES